MMLGMHRAPEPARNQASNVQTDGIGGEPSESGRATLTSNTDVVRYNSTVLDYKVCESKSHDWGEPERASHTCVVICCTTRGE